MKKNIRMKTCRRRSRTLLAAAERGDAYAQYQAGKLYREGYFLPRDDAGAKMFFERATKQENHFAEYALGKLHADETSPFFDETKAADWFERAAERERICQIQACEMFSERERPCCGRRIRGTGFLPKRRRRLTYLCADS